MVVNIKEAWTAFSPTERRNIAFYIAGIMLYKFGLEAFNGSITALMTNRYYYDAWKQGVDAKTFQQLGIAQGLNQAAQCVGSIFIAPLIKRFPTKTVLSCSIIVFGLFTAILLVADAATGGTFAPPQYRPPHKHPVADSSYSYYGDYNSDGIIPIYSICGIAYGMVELIRRVIPKDIVGGDVQKLRKLDSMVHIFYEVSGTSGAICTALGLIPYFGNNYSFIITPICFALCAVSWWMISALGFAHEKEGKLQDQPGWVKGLVGSFYLFFESVWVGAGIIFGSRKFFWMWPGYAFALYGHRYLESGIAPVIAKEYLGQSAWSQIIIGGSNFGELLGALSVFLFTNAIKTPIPWLRLDALFLLIVWYLPYWYPTPNKVSEAWRVAGTFVPISFGWAAGDVSMAAYIQAALVRKENEQSDVSPLAAVMSFLYVTYVVLYAVLGSLLGRYIDASIKSTGDARLAVRNAGGVQMTVLCAIVVAATLVPGGALTLNPETLFGEKLDMEADPGGGDPDKPDPEDEDRNGISKTENGSTEQTRRSERHSSANARHADDIKSTTATTATAL